MPTPTFAVGDTLVYPNQGLCRVTDIRSEVIAGQAHSFVSLVIVETGARVKVPEHKMLKNGVRPVAGHAEVRTVFDFLTSNSARASLDWKKRARDNTARLTEGGLLGLAEVVKGLQELSELRPLPPKERQQYNDARHLFVEELAVALGVQPADAEDALDLTLFPVGSERPKRSIEEFQDLLGDDDVLGDAVDGALDVDEGVEATDAGPADVEAGDAVAAADLDQAVEEIAAIDAVVERSGATAPGLAPVPVPAHEGSDAKRSPKAARRTAKRAPTAKDAKASKDAKEKPGAAPKKRGRPAKPKAAGAASAKAKPRAKKAK